MPGIGKSVPVDVLSSDRSLRARRIDRCTTNTVVPETGAALRRARRERRRRKPGRTPRTADRPGARPDQLACPGRGRGCAALSVEWGRSVALREAVRDGPDEEAVAAALLGGAQLTLW
jgi:hypothetical protein